MVETHSLPILVRIGKAGVTPTIIEEIKRQVRKNRVIKVKFLAGNAAGKDKKAFARDLAAKTNTKLVAQVGFVAVLSRV